MNRSTGRTSQGDLPPNVVPATIGFLETMPHNRLLASLPPEAAQAVQQRLHAVALEAGSTLYEAGASIRHVYFPVNAVVSLFSPMQSGAGAEVAVVGHEGVVGVGAFMGGSPALSSAVVQRAGRAWRMTAHDIDELARDVEPLMRQLLRYTQALFTQMAQTSACHSHHSLSAQLCCWLLLHVDRQGDDELRVTHERIAGLLGKRREGVTEAAGQLQREGLIRCGRGVIQVRDRAGLAQQSCECYGVMQRAYVQLCECGWSRPQGYGASAHAAGRTPVAQFA